MSRINWVVIDVQTKRMSYLETNYQPILFYYWPSLFSFWAYEVLYEWKKWNPQIISVTSRLPTLCSATGNCVMMISAESEGGGRLECYSAKTRSSLQHRRTRGRRRKTESYTCRYPGWPWVWVAAGKWEGKPVETGTVADPGHGRGQDTSGVRKKWRGN